MNEPFMLNMRVEIEGIRSVLVQRFALYTQTLNKEIQQYVEEKLKALDLEEMLKGEIERNVGLMLREHVDRMAREVLCEHLQKILESYAKSASERFWETIFKVAQERVRGGPQ